MRNFTSIIPFFSIFSALMVFEIFNFLAKKITILKEKTHFLFSIMVFSCIVGFSQFQNSINLDASLIKPWDLTCINKWMSENLKKEDIVARTAEVPMPGETTYLSYSNSFGNRTSYSYKELQEDKIDYAALDYELIHQYLFWWFGESGKSWGPPIQVLDNSFEGVVQKELSRHVVYSCIKPWPSIDPGYSLIKIQKPFAGQTVSVLSIDKEFKINTDSLDFYNNRVQLSGKIPVEENKKYIVNAFVKPDKDLSRETQNGALRVDFYPDNVSHPGKIKGKTASVSSRIWENDWQEKQIIEIAPKGTKYMIISFQAEDTQYGNTFFINKISISVSKVNPTVAEIKVANTKEIDNETLYYSFWF